MMIIYAAESLKDTSENKDAGWGGTRSMDFALFDVVFHWLQLRADYENTSTQRHLSGASTEEFLKSRGVADD